jgi:hypothetical protein
MLVEVAQTEVAHTNAPDCPCDECMRTSYAFLNTLPSLVNPETLVIRGEDPTRVSAVLAHRELPRQRCLLCGGDHSAENCPRIHPIDVTPLLLEVDALLEQLTPHPGPNCYCPDCMRRAVVLTATSYVTKLRFDAGLICQYCGDDHADTTCPQRRSLLAPRVCGNCQGRHSIQACDEIRAALFAA